MPLVKVGVIGVPGFITSATDTGANGSLLNECIVTAIEQKAAGSRNIFLPSGQQIAFIARHGVSHSISPSKVPSRGNTAALKSLGVSAIIAFSVVGSLGEKIKPGDFVIPDQIIDRTKGIRPASYCADMNLTAAHAGLGDPFSTKLSKWLETKACEALKKKNPDGVESKKDSAWGGDIINASGFPEAKLAREAGISYSPIPTATDYDSWRPHEVSVTASDVFKTLTQNAETSRFVVANVLEDFFADAPPEGFQEEEKGCMKLALMKQSDDGETRRKLRLSYRTILLHALHII